MKKKETSIPRFRIFIVLGLFVVLFSVVFARAFQLQVLKAGELKRIASSQHTGSIVVRAKRGDIYDRNLNELAVSIEVDSIYAQPAKVASARGAARTLSPILGINARSLEKRMKSSRSFVWLKRQVDLKESERDVVAGIDGIGILKESRRYYPNRKLAGNLLGFTGVDSVGLEGVELYYDEILSGETRRVMGERDAMGRLLIFGDTYKEVRLQGMEVELTIDKTIQYIAEKALVKAVKASKAAAGIAIVMDPRTGEILALANAPTIDPNNFKKYTPSQWRNRAVTDVFEPGSVMKLFMIAAAIEEGVVKPSDIFFCENGSYRVADRVFHDTKKHGWLSVAQILKYSSNIGSAKIGEELGPERLYRYLLAFGFADRTGVDLPGEASGSLSHYNDWSKVTLETVSFGQGISSTGIQLVSGMSAIANGGFLMRPYAVKAIRDPRGVVVKETDPVITRRVVSERTAATITRLLVGVTREGGTGWRAAVDGFEVAGKTATAQKPDLKNGGYMKGVFISSFLGFVPAANPRLVILVVLDEPGGEHYHGGTVAGPPFREIATRSLSYLGVFPDNPLGAQGQTGAPKVRLASARGLKPAYRVAEDPGEALSTAVPDFRGRTMRVVLRMAKASSIDVEVKGSGRAVSQRPKPGSSPPDKGRVVVWFQ